MLNNYKYAAYKQSDFKNTLISINTSKAYNMRKPSLLTPPI